MKRDCPSRKIVASATALALAFSLGIWRAYQAASLKPVVLGKAVTVDIDRGDSFNRITAKLIAAHANVEPFWFRWLAIRQHAFNKLKSGEYELPAGSTMPDILAMLVAGKTKRHSITFPEGWSFKQIANALTANPLLTHTGTDPFVLMASLGATGRHPEGEFFPDTYFFEKHTPDVVVLKKAYDKMQAVIRGEWQSRAEGLPFKSAYEALILASIVEKETADSAERAQIAGVFIRRLKQGIKLQTDPTVIYGMGETYQGDITNRDLAAETPYNTYRTKGLPPTPIAMPGRAAIHAVLHPADGDSLYFVAKGDGSHEFSATLAAHNKAVDYYQKRKK